MNTAHDVEANEDHYFVDIRGTPVLSSSFQKWAADNNIAITCSGDPIARYVLWRRPVVAPIVMPGLATQPGYVWKVYLTFRFERDALLYKLTFPE